MVPRPPSEGEGEEGPQHWGCGCIGAGVAAALDLCVVEEERETGKSLHVS